MNKCNSELIKIQKNDVNNNTTTANAKSNASMIPMKEMEIKIVGTPNEVQGGSPIIKRIASGVIPSVKRASIGSESRKSSQFRKAHSQKRSYNRSSSPQVKLYHQIINNSLRGLQEELKAGSDKLELSFKRIIKPINSSQDYSAYEIELKVSYQSRDLKFEIECSEYEKPSNPNSPMRRDSEEGAEKDMQKESKIKPAIKLNQLSSFGGQEMSQMLKETKVLSYLPSNCSIHSLQKFNTLAHTVFLKALYLELKSEGTELVLDFSAIHQGFFSLRKQINQQEYSVRFVHSYYCSFRILLVQQVGSKETMKQVIDLWVDKDFFDDNFEVSAASYIGQFYKNLILSEEDTKPKGSQELYDTRHEPACQILLKSMECVLFVKSTARKILEKFEKLTNNMHLYLPGTSSRKKYCLISQREQEYEFCFVQEDESRKNIRLVKLTNLGMELAQQENLLPITRINTKFGVDFSKLHFFEKVFFFTNLCLSDLSGLTIKNPQKTIKRSPSITNTDQEYPSKEDCKLSEEHFSRRLFPGSEYKDPLTISLITMADKFPIGLKVSLFLYTTES